MGEHRRMRNYVRPTKNAGETTCLGLGCGRAFYSEDKTRIRYCGACRIKQESRTVGRVALRTTAIRGLNLTQSERKRLSK